jgi:hypothetical protein
MSATPRQVIFGTGAIGLAERLLTPIDARAGGGTGPPARTRPTEP